MRRVSFSISVDERLLKEFDKLIEKEFLNRSRAIEFLIRVYVDSRREKSFVRSILRRVHIK